MALSYSTDGGETWTPCPEGIRIRQDIHVPGEDEDDGELIFNFAEEGLICDVWAATGAVIVNPGTSSETYDEIEQRLVDAND